MVATLALVNMIFRGDGSSNIIEGDSLNLELDLEPNRVFMNPPFALEKEYEWKFVDKALGIMKPSGLLFAVLPTTTMMSANDKRGEITWRKQMLKRHRLIAVIKLPEELFKHAEVSKGTYGVIIEAHRPHNREIDKILFGILDDGVAYSKTQKEKIGNMEEMKTVLGNYLATRTEPEYKPKVVDCKLLNNDDLDLSAENNIGGYKHEILCSDLGFVQKNLDDGKSAISEASKSRDRIKEFNKCNRIKLNFFFADIEKGKSGRNLDMLEGELPLISTSESRNGISSFVNSGSVKKIYPPGIITISSNGGSCCAFYHDYECAVNGDVFACTLKEEFSSKEFGLFLCSSINNESWRFNYYRKFNRDQLDKLHVSMPVDDNGELDYSKIRSEMI